MKSSRTHLHDPDDRPKRFLAHDLHRVVDVDENLRRDVGRAVLCFGEVRFGDESAGAL